MILLLGAVASIITEGLKYLSKRVGKELAGAYVLVAVFILCFIGGVVEHYADLSKWASWEVMLGSFTLAVTLYEAFIKRVWKRISK